MSFDPFAYEREEERDAERFYTGPDDPDRPDLAEYQDRSDVECSCEPCESPGYGHPGIPHCVACCAGSLIEAYNHDCPVVEHRELATSQWGPR